jgi:hypothetical protein
MKKSKLVLWTEIDAAFNSDSGHAGKVLDWLCGHWYQWYALFGPEKFPVESHPGRMIRLIESNTKCRNLKQFICKDFAAGAFLSEAPSPPRFLFGEVEQFCRFWIWLDSECLTPAEWSQKKLNTPPPNHTMSVLYCTVIWHREGGERVGEVNRERSRSKLGRKYKHDWLYLQSIISNKHLPQSPFTVNLFRWRHLVLVSLWLTGPCPPPLPPPGKMTWNPRISDLSCARDLYIQFIHLNYVIFHFLNYFIFGRGWGIHRV